nr:reverse transcriptase domain-containing protein [Tanacetum cinerariifolium]GEY99186.1 reverse transcriptase domain-containing protein [Tanacetum cinerariifolium]
DGNDKVISLNFKEASQYFESRAPSKRRSLKEWRGSRHARSMSRSPKPRRGHSESPRKRGPERRTVFKRLEKGVFHRHGDKGKGTTKAFSKSEGSIGGHWKSKPKRQKSSVEVDLSQPWVCKETGPFTPQIHYFDFLKTRMPSHIKTYDGSEDPKDHLKIFQVAAKMERLAILTWCHMFNSTLTGNARVWFDDLSKESINSYDDLNEAFLENYLQQENRESTEEFVRSGEVAASNHERKKSFPSWKQQEAGQKQNFKKGGFQNQQRPERKQDRFTLLTKSPKEIVDIDKGKFKPPPPMTTLVEKRNASKFFEFHGK